MSNHLSAQAFATRAYSRSRRGSGDQPFSECGAFPEVGCAVPSELHVCNSLSTNIQSSTLFRMVGVEERWIVFVVLRRSVVCQGRFCRSFFARPQMPASKECAIWREHRSNAAFARASRRNSKCRNVAVELWWTSTANWAGFVAVWRSWRVSCVAWWYRLAVIRPIVPFYNLPCGKAASY